MSYACDAYDGNAASILITNLDSGDVLAACGNHVADYITQMAGAMGVDLPHPNAITLEQLVAYAGRRDVEIGTIKGSGAVVAGRRAELQTVMEALAEIIGGAETAPDSSDGAPGQWSEPNAVEAVTQGLDATPVVSELVPAGSGDRPDADDPAPY